MIEIDGSVGEGGGQVLRSALSLSCLTGQGFRIHNIRKNRSKPGLMRQHLMAVQAAARISSAELAGDRVGSAEISFVPRAVRGGDYSFDIGTAGSVSLVLQTVIPALLSADRKSSVTVTGGTHVPFSPCWNYLSEIFWPAVSRLGVRGNLDLEAYGFYPKGGGRIRCRLQPQGTPSSLTLTERGRLLRITGFSAVGNLPLSIAQRERSSALHLLRQELGEEVPIDLEVREVRVYGQGTFIFIKAHYERAEAGFTSLGARGKPAELVGEEVARELLEHHATGMPVDPHLADQLVLYLARAQEGSRFATSRITSHLETNLLVAGYFLELKTELGGAEGAPGEVRIVPAGNRAR
ncbi:RNA 3'-phosphate cyclase, class II [Citrifermentans bemidjiense Bem]|uniref:RNA 3'-terminal phosphate cyclase n=1 Tax=Citrifermentans bemidjiense (strain ATCC BAA-1014 / DSM 16622 / JCM 12645 / Bem) TaxID=404380 RepID=B5EIC1_CITBB|nr:RNA 3'-terminal phosphate cyclase [Citrifermentans bemidjiense]ACH39823.1 RNA 3'-phosphate cyclase, class II [Citrifermentans bemidjiense Bem]